MRGAVGDLVLNYLGASDGTGLGAVYANLFPSRVGGMILDANLDPVAWTTPDGNLSFSLRLGLDEAQAADLTAFLNLCGKATRAACAFSAGTPAATRASVAAGSLADGPSSATAGCPLRVSAASAGLARRTAGAWPSGRESDHRS